MIDFPFRVTLYVGLPSGLKENSIQKLLEGDFKDFQSPALDESGKKTKVKREKTMKFISDLNIIIWVFWEWILDLTNWSLA